MEWLEVFIACPRDGLEALAGFLYAHGLTGLMIEDEAEFQAFLENPSREWDYIAEELVEEKKENGITFFLRDNANGREDLTQIISGLPRLAEQEKELFPDGLQAVVKNVQEEDWANNWKQYFKPFSIGEKLLIKPSWEEVPETGGKQVLEIDPGHIFGTGTHETTQLCLEWIEELIQEGDQVVDIGCGSGILSIGALLLGAAEADAVDIDPNAIQIAYENSDRNHIDRSRYHVAAGNILTDTALQESCRGKNYDMVFANIVADVIIALTDQVPEYIKAGGHFICSGIILEREEDVRKALKEHGFTVLGVKEKNSWAAIATRYDGK